MQKGRGIRLNEVINPVRVITSTVKIKGASFYSITSKN